MVVGRFYPYATDSRERETLPVWFAVLAIAVGYVIHAVVEHYYPTFPWFADFWSPLALYGLIYTLFARFAWRWPMLHAAGVVKIPDLNGHYSGSLLSSHNKHETPVPCEFDVHQTWTTISIRGKFDKSWSYNMVTGISVADCAVPRLTYEYYNSPVEGTPAAMHPHPGTMWFDVELGDSLVLRGDYYTGRGRRTTGSVTITRT